MYLIRLDNEKETVAKNFVMQNKRIEIRIFLYIREFTQNLHRMHLLTYWPSLRMSVDVTPLDLAHLRPTLQTRSLYPALKILPERKGKWNRERFWRIIILTGSHRSILSFRFRCRAREKINIYYHSLLLFQIKRTCHLLLLNYYYYIIKVLIRTCLI